MACADDPYGTLQSQEQVEVMDITDDEEDTGNANDEADVGANEQQGPFEEEADGVEESTLDEGHFEEAEEDPAQEGNPSDAVLEDEQVDWQQEPEDTPADDPNAETEGTADVADFEEPPANDVAEAEEATVDNSTAGTDDNAPETTEDQNAAGPPDDDDDVIFVGGEFKPPPLPSGKKLIKVRGQCSWTNRKCPPPPPVPKDEGTSSSSSALPSKSAVCEEPSEALSLEEQLVHRLLCQLLKEPGHRVSLMRLVVQGPVVKVLKLFFGNRVVLAGASIKVHALVEERPELFCLMPPKNPTDDVVANAGVSLTEAGIAKATELESKMQAKEQSKRSEPQSCSAPSRPSSTTATPSKWYRPVENLKHKLLEPKANPLKRKHWNSDHGSGVKKVVLLKAAKVPYSLQRAVPSCSSGLEEGQALETEELTNKYYKRLEDKRSKRRRSSYGWTPAAQKEWNANQTSRQGARWSKFQASKIIATPSPPPEPETDVAQEEGAGEEALDGPRPPETPPPESLLDATKEDSAEAADWRRAVSSKPRVLAPSWGQPRPQRPSSVGDNRLASLPSPPASPPAQFNSRQNGSGTLLQPLDNEGRTFDFERVVVNFANVGATFGKVVLRRNKATSKLFDYEGVRRCVSHLTEKRGLRVIGVIFDNFHVTDCDVEVHDVPEDIAAMCESIELTPRLTGQNHRSADDEMTIKCAYRRNCRFLDNDNYQDWLQHLADGQVRAWLEHCQEALQMRFYFDSGLGAFDVLDGNIPAHWLTQPALRRKAGRYNPAWRSLP